MADKPRVLVLGTGGTIGSKPGTKGRYKTGEMPEEELLKYVPDLKKIIEPVPVSVLRVHSADIQPADWVTIANTVYHQLEDVDGVIVTHGTNTMDYTSTAIAFMIQNANKPIIFTGSQSPPNIPGSDAQRNLLNAAMVASVPDFAEKAIVFNGKVYRASRSKKIDAKSFDALMCFENHVLGTVEDQANLKPGYQTPNGKPATLHNKLDTNVSLIKLYPGINPDIIHREIAAGVKGIVLEAFATGNLPVEKNSVIDAINEGAESGIPIVISSPCFLGRNWEGWILRHIRRQQFESKGIHVYDMMPETAVVKLMWALGQTHDLAKVKQIMQKNYINEITDISKIIIPE